MPKHAVDDIPTIPTFRAHTGIDSLDDLVARLRQPNGWSRDGVAYVQSVVELEISERDDVVWALVEVSRLDADAVHPPVARIVAHPYRVIRGVFHFDSIDELKHPPSLTCPAAFMPRAAPSERCMPWRRRWRAVARGDDLQAGDD